MVPGSPNGAPAAHMNASESKALPDRGLAIDKAIVSG
jgi:hypothetical protein